MNHYPIVFVHGLMGWGRDKAFGFPYFGMAEAGVTVGRLAKLDVGFARRALFPAVGPISSHHDRACELFYRLKGGTVHYGKEHARQYGHAECGGDRRAKPLYTIWDADHPVHLVGHSQGAPTIRKLQQLLAAGDFFHDDRGKSYRTSSAWVRSITSISGVLNGSLATYVLGCSLDDGTVHPYSAAAYAARTVGRVATEPDAAWADLRRYFYDVGLDHWKDTRGEIDYDAFLLGMDNAAYDLSVHASQIFNDETPEDPNTYYFSFVTAQTAKRASGEWVPKPRMSPFMQPIAREIGRFRGPLKGLRAPIRNYADWWENDGLVSVYAQDVPRGRLRHRQRPYTPGAAVEPGAWHVVRKLDDMDHVDIVVLPEIFPLPLQPIEQIKIYKGLYELLSGLE